MDSKGKVVVCLVGFRNVTDVMRCLPALSAQTYTEFELVICENGGPEAFAALGEVVEPRLKTGQAITLIADHSNPGYAGGINRCIAARPGCEFYWVLNPDTVPRPGALAAMVADIQARDLDATGGPIVLPSGRLRTCGGRWSRWLAFPIAIGMDLPADQCPTAAEVERRLDYISGASLLAARRLVEEAGLMREDYFLYGEEVEWCLRARAHGLKLGFTPAAEVLHFQGTTTGSGHGLGEQGRLPIYCNERNRILILRDSAAAPVFIIGVLGALLLIAWRYGRRGLWEAMVVALSGWRDGIMNRRGKPAWLVR